MMKLCTAGLLSGALAVALAACSASGSSPLDWSSSDHAPPDLALADQLPDRPLVPPGDATVIPGNKEILLLRGTVVTPDHVLQEGEVLLENDEILCVAASCAAEPEAAQATTVETNGIIYPGLIDAHNHTQYNYLPKWVPPKTYTNHNQWQGDSAYSDFMALHRQMDDTLMCEMVKYGELRSLVAGTTMIQGTPYRKCADTLIRNADLPYHGLPEGDTMRTNVIGVSTLDAADAAKLKADMDSGKVHSYVIHLAEGIDETARKEFDALESLGLLRSEVVVIHGTALGQTELGKLAAAKMPLVWSPSSNLDLYGATNNISIAQSLGLTIALAPDWTPSGQPNMLDELRMAKGYNHDELGDLWDDTELVKMVTSNPATALKFDKELGSLAKGKRADVLVLAGDRQHPYAALTAARLPQVRLVVVQGKALYGEPALMSALEPNAYCETVTLCAQSRVLCVKESDSSTDKLNQSLGDIQNALSQAYTPGLMPLDTNCQ